MFFAAWSLFPEVLLHTKPEKKKKWTFDHIWLHLYVNSSCSSSDPSCNDMTSALCFSRLSWGKFLCVFVFSVLLFGPESVTSQPWGCAFLYSVLVDCLSCLSGSCTWRQCGGNIVVLLWGIFSLTDTGLSGLYDPLNNTRHNHQVPVLFLLSPCAWL